MEKHKPQIRPTNTLIPTILLIVFCVFNLQLEGASTTRTRREFHNLFNYNFLGNQLVWIYQDGDNVDEPMQEYWTLDEMQEHLETVLSNAQNINTITMDWIEKYSEPAANDSQIHLVYRNATTQSQFLSFQDMQEFLFRDFKSFLASVSRFKLLLHLGKNNMYKSIDLEFSYRIEKNWFLKAELSPHLVQQNAKPAIFSVSRVLSVLLAATIILYECTTVLNTFNHNRNEGKPHDLSNHYWALGITLLNVLILFTSSYSSFLACLQLVPFLQEKGNKYLFSFSLRFALPYILVLILNVVIFLIGIIVYSLMQYPSLMFDNFKMAFFYYIYNDFQYATYEIFIQIENHGFEAYILYLSLYFYMVLVANNLLPSIFCALVRLNIVERQIKQYLNQLNTRCPQCNLTEKEAIEEVGNLRHRQSVELTVTSPKLSPFVAINKSPTSGIPINTSVSASQSSEAARPPRRKRFLISEEVESRGNKDSKFVSKMIQDKIEYASKLVEISVLELQIVYKQQYKGWYEPYLTNSLLKWRALKSKIS